MRKGRESELSRVLEKGYDINHSLLSKCGYYPLFRFIKFIDKKTGNLIQGQQLVCKDCTTNEPNQKCKHHSTLEW